MSRLISFLLLTLVVVSCGIDSDHFKIEGRLLNLNQGEFYVYSTNGGLDGIDTIKVTGGRFAYEIPCEKAATLILVFPNFSEQPVFARPGKSVEIKADASHLKELTVEGTKDNELMNRFRQQIVSASPPEIVKRAAQFIEDHPASVVSVYLVRKYFITSPTPDYKQALTLIELMMKQQTDNGELNRMYLNVKPLAQMSSNGLRLTAFGYAINGQLIDKKPLIAAQVTVISVWASWNYESLDIQRVLKRLQNRSRGRLKIVSICVDASRKDCRDILHQDSISWPTICDRQMLQTPVLKQLGLSSVPDNIVFQRGRIVARSLDAKKLEERVGKMINEN